MVAKTWMIVHATGDARVALGKQPDLDREATRRLVARLFPGVVLTELEDGDLCYTCPPDDELHAGCFPGVAVVAAAEFGIDYPSRLPARFISGNGFTRLHAMHSVVDWLAFATWENGQLKRALSVSPDSGVLENVGEPLPFEVPFWAGEHPAIDPEDEDSYPLPFHPLEMGEAALLEFFGYQIEGFESDMDYDPETIPLMRFKRTRPWWKFWR